MNRTRTLIASLSGILATASCGGGGAGSPATAPQGLDYPAEVAFYVLGVDAPPNAPTVIGRVDTWTIEPAPPDGLVFDPATGTIGGTPLELAPLTDYTVTAGNFVGSTQARLRLGVAPPPNVAFVAHPEDDTLLDLTIDAATGELRYNGYQPTTAGDERPAQVLVHPGGRFVFVASEGRAPTPSRVTLYEVSEADCRLQGRDAQALDEGPYDMALDAAGGFLYVTSQTGGTVAAFGLDESAATLTALGAPLATEFLPSSIALSRSGEYAFVANRGSSSISVFRVLSTGELVAHGSPRIVTGVPTRIVASPESDTFCVLFEDRERVGTFQLDRVAGTLGEVAEGPTEGTPSDLAAHPAGRLVFATNQPDASVSAYLLDGATGSITRAATTPIGVEPTSICFDASGQYAYVLCRAANEVAMFHVDADTGALASVGRLRTRGEPASIAIGIGPAPLVQEARYMYVANEGSQDLTTYTVSDSDGSLDESGPPVIVGHSPREVVADPLGRFVFSADTTGLLVLSLTVDPTTGLLSRNGPPTLLPGRPRGLDVDPSGRYLFVAMRDDDLVHAYEIDPTSGVLTLIDSRPAGDNPYSVSVDPTGRFVYVTNAQSDDITRFLIEDGRFVGSTHTATGPGNPLKVRFTPGGDRAFAALMNADHLVPYDIDPHDGRLTPRPPGRAAKDRPTSIAIHPTGRFAFAAINGTTTDPGRVSSYLLDEAWLSDERQYFGTGLNPREVVVEPSGRFLYVSNQGGNDVSVFEIDGDTGELEHTHQVPSGIAPRGIAFTTRFVRPAVQP